MTSSLFPSTVVLPPPIERVLRPLCSLLPVEEIPNLHEAVADYEAKTKGALARNEFTDIEMAHKIAALLSLLLEEYPTAPDTHRALIVGAARYFVLATDAEPDLSLLGFEDDALVLNYVLEQIGHPELRIAI